MKSRLFTLLILLAGLALLTAGCDTEAQASTEVAPEAVVESYYEWYLDYIGDRASGEMRNPLVDKAYRSSEYLSPAFVEQVDEIIASFDQGGYDPFLCAQDIPESVSVETATVAGDTASVAVHTSFAGHTFQVALQKIAGEWQIMDILCK